MYKVTSVKRFTYGGENLCVEISDTKDGFVWRMQVGESWSNWTTYYQGVLVHEGFGLATAYYDPDIKEFVPFKINYATQIPEDADGRC